jgi:hypothetical protein
MNKSSMNGCSCLNGCSMDRYARRVVKFLDLEIVRICTYR